MLLAVRGVILYPVRRVSRNECRNGKSETILSPKFKKNVKFEPQILICIY